MQHYDAREDQLIAQLNHMKELLLCNQGAHSVITCDTTEYSAHVENGLYGLCDLACKPFTPWKGDIAVPNTPSQAKIIAAPVAFTAKSFATVSYTHPSAPAIAIAANLFENKVLHTRIREQGGAYGAGASYSAMTGSFYFYSYSDPHIASSLFAFEESIHTILNGTFTDNDLEEAKLGMIQGLDAPVSPSGRGDVAYAWWREGKDMMKRMHFRNCILDLTKADVIYAVEHYIKPPFSKGTVVTFAKQELIQQENKKLGSGALTMSHVF